MISCWKDCSLIYLVTCQNILYLYNWYAVDDIRGLCPTGWSVASDENYTTLTDLYGGESVAGESLKSSAWNGTNSSGFSAVPGGYRGYQGNWGEPSTDHCYIWSQSPALDEAWARRLFSGVSTVYRGDYPTKYGFSVRCIKDTE